MRRLARRDVDTPDVVALARKIRRKALADHSGDPKRSRLEQAKAAFHWVVDTIAYRFDHEHVVDRVDGIEDPRATEFLIAPQQMIGESIFEGDCDDMATTLASILGALGFSVRFKVIAHRTPAYSHVYLEALLPTVDGGDRWVPLDPVAGATGFGWEKTPIIRKKTYEVF